MSVTIRLTGKLYPESLGGGNRRLDAGPFSPHNRRMAVEPDPASKQNVVPFRGSRPVSAKRSSAHRDDTQDPEPLSARRLLGIGIFLVLLVIAGVWLMDTLRSMSKLEECAMQGRKNCREIVVPLRDR